MIKEGDDWLLPVAAARKGDKVRLHDGWALVQAVTYDEKAKRYCFMLWVQRGARLGGMFRAEYSDSYAFGWVSPFAPTQRFDGSRRR